MAGAVETSRQVVASRLCGSRRARRSLRNHAPLASAGASARQTGVGVAIRRLDAVTLFHTLQSVNVAADHVGSSRWSAPKPRWRVLRPAREYAGAVVLRRRIVGENAPSGADTPRHQRGNIQRNAGTLAKASTRGNPGMTSGNDGALRHQGWPRYDAAMPDDEPPILDPAEDCPWRSPREIFARFGYAPLPPDELNDLQLPGRLWELLHAAAARRLFFHATDHLSDHEFYTLLWEQWLDEPVADIPLEAETNTTLMVSELNANGMTHEEIWLRYYAEPADRMARSPGEVIPPHEEPPFDRDRHLPVPPVPREAQADQPRPTGGLPARIDVLGRTPHQNRRAPRLSGVRSELHPMTKSGWVGRSVSDRMLPKGQALSQSAPAPRRGPVADRRVSSTTHRSPCVRAGSAR